LTLQEYLDRSGAYFHRHPGGGVQVFVRAADKLSVTELFRLSDYVVSSSGSGPSYWLVPRDRGGKVNPRGAPHGTFRRIRRAVARRPDVDDPSALAAWIKRKYYGSNPALTGVRVVGSNMVEVTHGDATILFSYKTPVAAFVEGHGMFATDKFWSRTTSTHIGKWLREMGFDIRGAKRVAQELIEDIARGGGLPGGVATHRNPTLAILGNPRRKKIARRVLCIDYVHAEDGKKYTHDFTEDTDHGDVCAYVEDGGRRVVLEARDGKPIVGNY